MNARFETRTPANAMLPSVKIDAIRTTIGYSGKKAQSRKASRIGTSW